MKILGASEHALRLLNHQIAAHVWTKALSLFDSYSYYLWVTRLIDKITNLTKVNQFINEY